MSVDLHLHTNASDGSMSSAEVVLKAIELGYSAIAITDHDTVEGIDLALETARASSLEVIPGIEINTDVDEKEVHILGYYIDHNNSFLQDELEKLKIMREMRAKKMLANLAEEGVKIEWEYLLEIAGRRGTIGRGHIGRALIEKGVVSTWEEAFEKYIGKDCSVYEPRKRLKPGQAVRLINRTGGIPVLAHPGLVEDDRLIEQVIGLGIKGIEVYYYEHSEKDINRFRKLAKKYNLVMTGGSDDHGPGNKDGLRLGKVRLDYSIVENLRSLWLKKS